MRTWSRQLLAWYQALASTRLALDARDAAPIIADLEAARLLAPRSEVAPQLERASARLRRFKGR